MFLRINYFTLYFVMLLKVIMFLHIIKFTLYSCHVAKGHHVFTSFNSLCTLVMSLKVIMILHIIQFTLYSCHVAKGHYVFTYYSMHSHVAKGNIF